MKKITLVAIALCIVACSDGGSKLEGRWIGTDGGRTLMTVERNNDEYLVRLSDTKLPNNPAHPIPARLQDGKLVMSSGGSTVTYINATNTVVVSNMLGGLEFKRAK